MFFKKKKEVEEVKEESLIEHYRHKVVPFKKPEIDRNAVIKSIFQRDFSMLTPKNLKGKVVGMDGAVCKCKFNADLIPNDILQFYGSHNFIGFEACAILRQNPYIDKACTIPAQDAISPDYKISYAENNKDEKKVDDEKLEEMKRISDKDYNIKEICYHANVNKKTFGISLVVPVIDGVDYKKPYSIDKVKKGSYKGMVVVEPYWVSPQLDSGAVSNPMNVGFQEPTWWRMPDGTVVHKSWCIKKCNSELPDILKPTYYYGGVPLTQKIYERVYAAEKVANEAPQLALTKRMLIADANIANLMANPEECQSILNLVQWARDNFSVWFKNPDDQVSQIDTSLTDFDALVMTQYQLVASIADMPATKLLKTQPKGFNATGEYEQKDYIQSLQAIQEQDYLPILKMHYELFTKSFYGELVDLSIVFNPIDTPTEKETAEVAKIWSDIDSNYIASGVVSADEIRDIRRSEEGSAYSTLADDIEGEVTPEVDNAVDEALDEKWITVKNDHGNEEEKGRHLLLEDGETPAEAMKRQWGVEVKKEEKKDEPKEENTKKEEKTSESQKENSKESSQKEENSSKTKTYKVSEVSGLFGSDKIAQHIELDLPQKDEKNLSSLIGEALYKHEYNNHYNDEIEIPEKFKNVGQISQFIKKLDIKDSDKENYIENINRIIEREKTYKEIKNHFENPPKGENIDSYGNTIKNPEKFKEWFGNSKAQDKNGNPIVLFHGSKIQDLEGGQFDFKHKGNSQNKQKAIFTNTRKDVAESYTDSLDGNKEKGKLHKVFVKIEKPLIVDFEGKNFSNGGGKEFSVHPYGEEPSYRNETIIKKKSRVADSGEAPIISKIVNYAKKNGYDGVIAKNIVDAQKYENKYDFGDFSDDYIVFDPKTQIKSVENNGEWSGKTIYDEALDGGEGSGFFNHAGRQGLVGGSAKKDNGSIESSNFKKWFGKSKVVDKNGNPLPVYHGGKKGIKEFDKSKISGKGQWGNGFYFTPEESEAKGFAIMAGNGEVYKAFLKIENPLIDRSLFLKIEREFDEDMTKTTHKIKEMGYDGVIMGSEYVAFEPSQIRIVKQNALDQDDDIIAWRRTKTGQPFPIKRNQTVKEALNEFVEAKEKPEIPENVLAIETRIGIVKHHRQEYLEVDEDTYKRICADVSEIKRKDFPKGTEYFSLLSDGIYILELEPKDKYYNFKIKDIWEHNNVYLR